jgi:hypothetical protein
MKICRTCGISNDKVTFAKARLFCRPCYSKNQSKNNKRRHRMDLNRFRSKDRLYRQKIKEATFEAFLADRLKRSKREDKKQGRECNLDLSYLLELLNLQDQCCAATGIKMVHRQHDLRAISIDRIDSSKGHVKGNIQLTCWFYNRGKGACSDIQARQVVHEMKTQLG